MRSKPPVVLENDGSADANDGVLRLHIEPALDEVAVFEGGRRLALEGRSADSLDTVELGTLEAYETRRLTIRARAPSPFANARELRIGASLHTRELGETQLRNALWRVDSHPAFDPETSRLELGAQSVLRPNQLADVDVIVTNIGTDTAHNVSLRCYISPEARLESVDGATREKSSLLFGELAPGAHARARLGLRLLRGLAKDWPVTVDSLLTADGMLPVPLERLTIATTAEPDFSTGNLQSEPADTVDPGETVEWFLYVRNGGDGTARIAQITIVGPESLIYVPNSTTVNDVPIRDSGALPPFAGARGIVLNDVDPGVEVTIRWRSVVHNALPAGTSIAQVAHIRYDGERDDEIASAQLRIRATPIFANAIPGLPFGLDGMLGPALAAHPRALSEDRFLQLPPATPVGESNGSHPLARLSAAPDDDVEDPPSEVFETTDATGTIVAFTPDRLGRTLRLLREARFRRLDHAFVCRARLSSRRGRRRPLQRVGRGAGTAPRGDGSALHQASAAALRSGGARRRNAVAAFHARTLGAGGRCRTRRAGGGSDRRTHVARQFRSCGVARSRRAICAGAACHGAPLGCARAAFARRNICLCELPRAVARGFGRLRGLRLQ